ncbi:hypothetical protein B5807_07967 [Epicoccum nigrum]|uniref:Uncharacterized protein n=1 Tax=Epicoccum nigrum TaxID=105696 RepID=A0A1Y2LX78_EPING|nr:hypothetical protein B5807_07967 [Epicoccum nigrum]
MLDSASNKDKAKVGRVKRTLCVKWTFTCEQGGADKQKQHLKNWRGFSYHGELREVVVDFAIVPVFAEYANRRLGVASATHIKTTLAAHLDDIAEE